MRSLAGGRHTIAPFSTRKPMSISPSACAWMMFRAGGRAPAPPGWLSAPAGASAIRTGSSDASAAVNARTPSLLDCGMNWGLVRVGGRRRGFGSPPLPFRCRSRRFVGLPLEPSLSPPSSSTSLSAPRSSVCMGGRIVLRFRTESSRLPGLSGAFSSRNRCASSSRLDSLPYWLMSALSSMISRMARRADWKVLFA